MAAAVQTLEERTMLSGNVSASFNGVTLRLTGDAASNDVEVLINNSGGYQITGMNGTTINGQMQITRASSNLSNFVAIMGDGHDRLHVSCNGAVPAHLSGRAWINLGNGDDTLDVQNMGFQYGLMAYGGWGEDDIRFDQFRTGSGWFSNLWIDAGPNDDLIDLDNINAGANVIIRGGDGSDAISLFNVNTSKSIAIAGGDGSDLLSLEGFSAGGYLGIWGGSGHDDIFVEGGAIRYHAFIDGGDGDDVIDVSNTSINRYLHINGSWGDDEIYVNQSSVRGKVAMYGGFGSDYLEFSESTGDTYVGLSGGWGKDTLVVNSSSVGMNLGLYGGLDHDVTSVENTNVDGYLYWNGGWGNDGFGMANTSVGGFLKLNGDAGDDLMGIANSIIYGEALIYGSWGNDALVLSDVPGGVNTFHWNVFVSMGFGDDAVHICGSHNFAHDLVILGGWFNRDRINIEEMQNVGGRSTIIQFRYENDPTVEDRVEQMFDALAECFPEIVGTSFARLCRGGIGPISMIGTKVAFPRAQTTDANSDGIVNPGDQFELDFLFTNDGTQAVAVDYGQNVTIIGPGTQVGGVGEIGLTVQPGETVQTDAGSDACIAVSSTAQPGDEIFIEFDVTVDGVTVRFRSGPYIVGQIQDCDTAAATQVSA